VRGNQRPTFSAGFLPDAGEGKNAADMSRAYGYALDPWQEMLLRQCFAEGALQIGFTAPRQNGKNGVLEALELYAVAVLGQRVIHTAHEVRTALVQFSRMNRRWFENPKYPDLSGGATVMHGRGSEEVIFKGGGDVVFLSRSSILGRGFTADWLILDEAQEMGDEDWESLGPTLTASPDARIVLTGTAPISSRVGKGVIFQRYRQRAYDGELDAGNVYAEWGVDDLARTDIRDVRVWERVNPAWNFRINKQVVRANFATMEKEGFCREHLGYWFKGAKNTCYGEKDWKAGLVKRRPTHEEAERFAVGIVYAQDGESWAAAFGAVLKDGGCYAELIDLAPTGKGNSQILRVVAALRKREGWCGVLAHGKAGTLNLIGDAEADRLFPAHEIEICRHADKIASNGLFDTLMAGGALKHVDQEPLRESVTSLDKLMKSASGGGFEYVSRTGRLIAAEAAALAVYWAKNRKPKPKRGKQRIL
jgi:hypothetical protein